MNPSRTIKKYTSGLGLIEIEVPVSQKMKSPSYKTMMRWIDDGRSKATDGCWVEIDGICPHGCRSWLLELGIS